METCDWRGIAVSIEGVVSGIDCREAIDGEGERIVRDGQGRIYHAANEA